MFGEVRKQPTVGWTGAAVGKVNLRKLARGQECQLRLHDVDGVRICNFNTDTVCLCHLRLGGVAGLGQKPPDLCAVYACSDCHDVVDGRVKRLVPNIDMDLLRALLRTLAIVSKELGL